MHDDFKELEEELRHLRPADPAAHLTERIGRSLALPRRRMVFFRTALPLAAMLTLGLVLWANFSGKAPVASPESIGEPSYDFKPVAAENVLYDTRDEGLVTLEDGTPARRTRNSYVETITWRNPRTQASVRWSFPRDEVRVVPVSFQ